MEKSQRSGIQAVKNNPLRGICESIESVYIHPSAIELNWLTQMSAIAELNNEWD